LSPNVAKKVSGIASNLKKKRIPLLKTKNNEDILALRARYFNNASFCTFKISSFLWCIASTIGNSDLLKFFRLPGTVSCKVPETIAWTFVMVSITKGGLETPKNSKISSIYD
jgi:hypothetical protein